VCASATSSAVTLRQSGDQIALTLTNRLNAPVELRVGGTDIAVTVGAGQTTRQPYTFSAPAPGTYLYYDGQNGGVNRVMGLHGALVVMPAGVKNRSYVGGPSFWRQYKWLLNSIDSAWSQRLRSGGLSAARGIVPTSFQPRYFTLNGRNFPATHEPNTELAGNYGEAALVRCLNAGGMVHALHFHGNHVKIVSINRSQENLRDKDIIPMLPLDCRDAIFPFTPPPDAWPAVNGTEQHYPMHCHVEMSQTAGGGSYPHGLHAPIVFGRGPMQEPDLTRDVAVLR
jgi:FtsP/CotA-like multicopper oxidase with cupredoxin domain